MIAGQSFPQLRSSFLLPAKADSSLPLCSKLKLSYCSLWALSPLLRKRLRFCRRFQGRPAKIFLDPALMIRFGPQASRGGKKPCEPSDKPP